MPTDKHAPVPPPPDETRPRSRYLGITGKDMSASIYDGSSLYEYDHLIELEDDSMEREPDIRAYFWHLGQIAKSHSWKDVPRFLEQRQLYDDEIVRVGREYLRKARERGKGFYFNKDRLVLGTNRPGDHWYCMPAARVAATMDEDPHALPRQPDEGAFYEGRDDVAYTKDGTILTNLRAPFLWANCMKETIQPERAAWDFYIIRLYTADHPIQQARSGREPSEAMVDLECHPRGMFTDEATVVDMIRRYWPEETSSPELPPVNLMKLTGSGKPEDFFKNDYKPRNAGRKTKKWGRK